MNVTTEKATKAAKPPPKSKKLKPEQIKVSKAVVTDLASCVLWALKYLKTSTGGGMWTKMAPGEPVIILPWQEKFMQALDGVGYKIDRKDFWKKQDAPKKRRRR